MMKWAKNDAFAAAPDAQQREDCEAQARAMGGHTEAIDRISSLCSAVGSSQRVGCTARAKIGVLASCLHIQP